MAAEGFEDAPEQEAHWLNALPFACTRNGDKLGLDMRRRKSRRSSILAHDDDSKVVALDFDTFLETWERLCYIGPEIWLLKSLSTPTLGFLTRIQTKQWNCGGYSASPSRLSCLSSIPLSLTFPRTRAGGGQSGRRVAVVRNDKRAGGAACGHQVAGGLAGCVSRRVCAGPFRIAAHYGGAEAGPSGTRGAGGDVRDGVWAVFSGIRRRCRRPAGRFGGGHHGDAAAVQLSTLRRRPAGRGDRMPPVRRAHPPVPGVRDAEHLAGAGLPPQSGACSQNRKRLADVAGGRRFSCARRGASAGNKPRPALVVSVVCAGAGGRRFGMERPRGGVRHGDCIGH